MRKMSILTLVAATLCIGACVNVDVGDVTGWGGDSSPKEEAQKFLRASFNNVWASARDVARSMMKVTESKTWTDDGMSRGKIKGKGKDDVRYEINLEDKGSKGVEVKVKVKGEDRRGQRDHGPHPKGKLRPT